MKIWTLPELEALQQRYPVEPTAVLAVDFAVTPQQIRHKAYMIGLKKQETRTTSKYRNHKAQDWTEAEDAEIRTWWPVITAREQPGKNAEWFAGRLGVSLIQVRSRAAALGLRKPRQKEWPWTDEELELLDQYLHLNPTNIRYRLARRGYHRTEAAITVQR